MKLFVFSVWGLFIIFTCVETREFKYQPGYCKSTKGDFMQLLSLATKKVEQLPASMARALVLRSETFEKVEFNLFTRRNPNERQILQTNNNKTLGSSNFDVGWPIRFIIHGWNSERDGCSLAAIKDAYLTKDDFNVILVDWSAYATNIDYFQVVGEISGISQQITNFARFLHDSTGALFENMYLIGHSLGAHVAGTSGKLLAPDLYGVIYGLDPAGPLFDGHQMPTRLSPSDAIYVESIHTDISFLGVPANIRVAHASFFPNWGLGQPHCPDNSATEPDITCDHYAALYYFVYSIIGSRSFGAIECGHFKKIQRKACFCPNGRKICFAQAYMGGEPAVPKRGVYYLSTLNKRAYGKGEMCSIGPAYLPTLTRITTDPMALLQKTGDLAGSIIETAVSFGIN